jgi:dienelactone hydrolase
MRRSSLVLALAIAAATAPRVGAVSPPIPRVDVMTVRGHELVLHLYGPAGGDPVVLASGDGGWVHLAPHLAEWLAQRGYFVVGVDSRAYLASFTSAAAALSPDDVSADFAAFAARAAAQQARRPVLAGVSEGAGLSVLAAGNPAVQRAIRGVLVFGLPDMNELGWRWRDAVIYVTHGVPNEPLFSAASVIGRVAPLPLAGIYASHDEYVPAADVRRLGEAAGEPKHFWVVAAANHRFSDNLDELDARLCDALAWMADRGR